MYGWDLKRPNNNEQYLHCRNESNQNCDMFIFDHLNNNLKDSMRNDSELMVNLVGLLMTDITHSCLSFMNGL